MRKIVVISGSGISSESGIPTFRDMGGLWKQYDVTEVASPVAWQNNPEMVMEFYNFRRKGVVNAKPNKAHLALKELESKYDVHIVTQNVDDLHERAGSSKVLHLHGEIRKARSTKDNNIIVDIEGYDLNIGDLCPLGSQLRPHIVWFGEAVDKIPEAVDIIKTAEIVIVIGTSLQVYPAAGLVDYSPTNAKKFLIAPSNSFIHIQGFEHIKETAVIGTDSLLKKLM